MRQVATLVLISPAMCRRMNWVTQSRLGRATKAQIDTMRGTETMHECFANFVKIDSDRSRHWIATVLHTALMLCLATGVWAQGTIQPPDALNHNAAIDVGSNLDQSVDLATDELGTWIAVWHAPADDTSVDCSLSPTGGCGADGDIMFAVITNAGGSWSHTHFLNTDAESDSTTDSDPKIATDGKGNWLVIWKRSSGMAASRSVDNGQSWTAPAMIPNLNFAGSIQYDSHELVTDRRGVWNLIWSSDAQSTGGDFDVFVTRSTNNGVSWSASIIPINDALGDTLLDHDTEPALATDGTGQWVAVWESDLQAGGLGVDTDILASTSVDGGLTWSSPVSVNDDATSDSSIALDRDPSIATDQRGIWVTVWHEFQDAASPTGIDSDVLYARSTSVGATWSASQPVDPNAATDGRSDFQAVIETDLNGSWHTAWEAFAVFGENDLLISTSTAGGTAWGAPVLLNTNALTDNGSDIYPDLKSDRYGNWVAVWDSSDDLGGTVHNDSDIFFTTFSTTEIFPVNDLSIRATEILAGEPVFSLLELATPDGTSNCGGETDVWYRLDPPAPGPYLINTCSTNDMGGIDAGMDTVLSVHFAEPGTGANELDCNDDWSTGTPVGACQGADVGLPRDSSLEVSLAGDPVWIRIANYSGTPQGAFFLEALPEPSQFALLTAGVAGLILLARTRRNRGGGVTSRK